MTQLEHSDSDANVAPSRLLPLLTWPTFLLLIAFAKVISFFDILLWYFVTIPFHEMGHSLWGLLGSRVTIPLGVIIPMAGQTIVGNHFSWVVFLALATALAWALSVSWMKHANFSLVLLILCAVSLLYWSFFVTDSDWKEAMIIGGVRGELLIGTAFAISFYYPLIPHKFWEILRFPISFMGLYSLVSSFWKWRQISKGREPFPSGTFLGGASDANGDLDRLIQDYGWTAAKLSSHFVQLSYICILVIALHYLHFLIERHHLEKMNRE